MNENEKNPIWVGSVFSAYLLSSYVYFTNVFFGIIYYVIKKNEFFLATNHYLVMTFIFFLLNMIFVPLYIYLLFKNPGFIEKDPNEWKV